LGSAEAAALGSAEAAALGSAEAAAQNNGVVRRHYQLMEYEVETEAQRGALLAFLGDAAIPAINRLGLTPVGVFLPAEELSPVYVLIPHPSAESALTLTRRLIADNEFLSAGAAFLDAPATNPAYTRQQNSLMLAFTGMPKLDVPAHGPGRVFQLRIYESPSIKAGQKKIEMFNTAEIGIFRKVGLTPVFFGETLFGTKMPNLTYMLGFNDIDAQKAAWKAFGKDPDWLELRAVPEYADKKIISNITNILLKPAEVSQI